MCGIVGYIGRRDSVPIILDALRRLEYRGYDSAGIAVIDPSGKLTWFYKQDPALFSSIQNVLLLDGLDPQYLHLLAAAGTWAPVVP